MISPLMNLLSMSKLHIQRTDKFGSASARRRAPQVAVARARRNAPGPMRHDAALEMIQRILHAYFRIDAHPERERVIQW